MKRYKFLKLVRGKIKSASGNETWKVGEWKKLDGKPDLCNYGFHCSKTPYQAFSYVQGEVLAVVEVRGKKDIQDDKEAWQEMRIVKAYKWTKKDSVAFAIYAAELVLENYEKEYPDDKRPREAIEAARKVLFKDTAKNRSAALSAWSAARSAESAARSAESAARSAESAARSAESAARSAARSAESAAWSAESAALSAWSAALSAWSAALSAWSAARSAAYKKLGKWMENHIKELDEI